MKTGHVRIFKLRKRWADEYAMIGVGFGLVLMTGIQFALDRGGSMLPIPRVYPS